MSNTLAIFLALLTFPAGFTAYYISRYVSARRVSRDAERAERTGRRDLDEAEAAVRASRAQAEADVEHARRITTEANEMAARYQELRTRVPQILNNLDNKEN